MTTGREPRWSRRSYVLPFLAVALLASCSNGATSSDATTTSRTARSARDSSTTDALKTVPGMPPIIDPKNIYSEAGVGMVLPRIKDEPARVYVPNGVSNTVSVIDPATFKVVATIPAGWQPQHIVVSYDMNTLWELNDKGQSLMPIDPATGRAGATIPVRDPYNLYFTPDGKEAVVVAEALRMLDYRDPRTMELHSSLHVTDCEGINHSDYSARGDYAIFTCEFNGKLAKVDVLGKKVLGYLDLGGTAMPQDVRAAPDGRTFYVADMMTGGVHVVDGDAFKITGFIPTGVGTHGLNPSRDGKVMYISNRGSRVIHGSAPHGPGSISVLEFATKKIIATWTVPGGGSPDMGNITADGTQLWLSGRYDSEVYVFDLVNAGLIHRIRVGGGPHGLAVWPIPGRVSFGHTGNTR